VDVIVCESSKTLMEDANSTSFGPLTYQLLFFYYIIIPLRRGW